MATRFGYYYNTLGRQIPVKDKMLPTMGKIHSGHPDFESITPQYMRFLVSEEKIPNNRRQKYIEIGDMPNLSTLVDNLEPVVELPIEETPIETFIEKIEELAIEHKGVEVVSEHITIEESKEATIENVVENIIENLVEAEPKEEEVPAKKKVKKTKTTKLSDEKEG